MTEQEREELIADITERELKMFMATPSLGGESELRDRPETFRLMRHMAHSAHDEAFLQAYLTDLREAEKSGRNLMAEKYARFNNLMPASNKSELPDEIAKAETEFLIEASDRFPEIIRKDGSERFRDYFRAEMETLSPASLALYAEEVRKAKEEGRNLALERHNWLASKLGKPQLR